MMHKIQTLTVNFHNSLLPREINLFRGAVGNLMRQGSILFHNHDGDQLRYAYPLIQYKTMSGKAAIICLNDGASAIYQLLSKGPVALRIGDRSETFKVLQLTQTDFELNLSDTPKLYDLNNWMPLNETNYRKFNKLKSAEEQVGLLESILTTNILEFARGVDWFIPEKVHVQIMEIQKQYPLKYKGVSLHAFNLTFAANVVLPPFVGLGKGTSSGHGILRNKVLNTIKP